MALDPATRQFGEVERAKAIALRDEQSVIINYWNNMLGDAGLDGGSGGVSGGATPEAGPTHSGSARPGAKAAEFVGDAEFIGMSAPAAIKTLMERMVLQTGQKRPLRVPEMHAAIKKGGIEYGKDALYTTIARSPHFHSPQKGLWGLMAWYPNATKKPRVDAQGKPLPEGDDEVVEAEAEVDVDGAESPGTPEGA